MPIHDWTRVPSGVFHDFHQTWSTRIRALLNQGILPRGVTAMVEQRTGPKTPDILSVESRRSSRHAMEGEGGSTLVLDPPAAPFRFRSGRQIDAGRANRIVVKHHLGRTLAVVEIVSPGNKDSRSAIADFIDKTIEYLRLGIHVLVIDLFPPTTRDPDGLHQLIWDEVGEGKFHFPPGRDRAVTSYEAGDEREAFVFTAAVGEDLPDAPLFLWEGAHVMVPLEKSYRNAWSECTPELQSTVETGVLPEYDSGDGRP